MHCTSKPILLPVIPIVNCANTQTQITIKGKENMMFFSKEAQVLKIHRGSSINSKNIRTFGVDLSSDISVANGISSRIPKKLTIQIESVSLLFIIIKNSK